MSDPETLLVRASQLIEAGRTNAARPILAAIRSLVADDPRVVTLGALLDIREGHLIAARDALDCGIENWPQHIGVRTLRAELRFRLQDLPGALEDAAECVLQDSHNPTSKALLGMLLLEAGHAKDAAACLDEAVRGSPTNAGFVQALATAQEAMGDVITAADTLQNGAVHAPQNVNLRSAAVLLAVRQKNFEQAVIVAQATQTAGIADACTFGLLGHALSSLGRHSEAADAYREALKLGPDDLYVRHIVAASGVVASGDRAPDEYIRTIFEGYAEHFEEHLIGLGYRVPGITRAGLLRYRPGLNASDQAGPLLDLGCGTGLIAVALSDLSFHDMVGVDLSPRMLAQAARKNSYSELYAEEVGSYLRREVRRFSFIVAADVLCYFGDLDPVMSEIFQRTSDNGILIFSVEELEAGHDEKHWNLGRQGRFAHSFDYIRDCGLRAGFRICEIRRETLRNEAGAPVSGILAIMERIS